MDTYQRLGKRELYRNRWLTLEAHEIVHPTGAPGEHVLVVSPSPSAVLVIDGDDVILADQPRFAAQRNVVEIVKGGADPGEDALTCAKRELREELGLEAASWMSLGHVYEIPSIVYPAVAVFVASDIRDVESDPEAVEQIGRLRMSLDDAYEAAIDGRINDAVTLAALLRYRGLSATAATGS